MTTEIHNYIRTAFLALAITAAGVAIGRAAGGGADPRAIVYHGYLEDTQGPISGRSVSIVFELYAAVSGGSPLWTSNTEQIDPRGGHFSVVLGDDKPLTSVWDNVPRSGRLFLAMSVDGELLNGRQELFPAAMAVSGVPQSQFHAQDVGVSGTLVAKSASIDSLTVGGPAQFRGPLSVAGDVTASGSLTVGRQLRLSTLAQSATCVATESARSQPCSLGTRTFCALSYFAFYGDSTDGWPDERYCDVSVANGNWTLTARLGMQLRGEVQCRATCF